MGEAMDFIIEGKKLEPLCMGIASVSLGGRKRRIGMLLGVAKEEAEKESLRSELKIIIKFFRCALQLPAFFAGHHTYSMYAPNLIFTNNLLPLSCKLYSRWSYRSFLATTSALLRLGCAQLNLDLLRITKDVDRGRVEARWRLRGRPRYRLRER